MRTVLWRIKPNAITNSELDVMQTEELVKKGQEYIEKLKEEGEEVISVEESEQYLTIKLKDEGDSDDKTE